MEGHGPRFKQGLAGPGSDQDRNTRNSFGNLSKHTATFQSIEDTIVGQSIQLQQHSIMLQGLENKQEILEGQIWNIQSQTNRFHHQFSEDLFGLKIRLEAMEKVVTNNSPEFIEVPIRENPIQTQVYRQEGFLGESNQVQGGKIPHVEMKNEVSGAEFNSTFTNGENSKIPQVIKKNATGRYICPNCGLDFAPIYILRHMGKRICRNRAQAWNHNPNFSPPDIIQF